MIILSTDNNSNTNNTTTTSCNIDKSSSMTTPSTSPPPDISNGGTPRHSAGGVTNTTAIAPQGPSLLSAWIPDIEDETNDAVDSVNSDSSADKSTSPGHNETIQIQNIGSTKLINNNSSSNGNPQTLNSYQKISSQQPLQYQYQYQHPQHIINDENTLSNHLLNISQNTIFIGNLPRDTTTFELGALLKDFGPCQFHLKKSPSGQSEGYGFAKFKSKEEAIAAMNEINQTTYENRDLKSSWASENSTIFVYNVDIYKPKEELFELFRRHGTFNEADCYFKSNYVLITYFNRAEAQDAIHQLNGKVFGNRPLSISWGDSIALRTSVYIVFDPDQVSAKQVEEERTFHRKIFDIAQKFGKTNHHNIPKNHETGKYEGYGFIHFRYSKNGEAAAESMIQYFRTNTVDGVQINCSFAKKKRSKKMPNDAVDIPKSPKHKQQYNNSNNGYKNNKHQNQYHQEYKQQQQQQPPPQPQQQLLEKNQQPQQPQPSLQLPQQLKHQNQQLKHQNQQQIQQLYQPKQVYLQDPLQQQIQPTSQPPIPQYNQVITYPQQQKPSAAVLLSSSPSSLSSSPSSSSSSSPSSLSHPSLIQYNSNPIYQNTPQHVNLNFGVYHHQPQQYNATHYSTYNQSTSYQPIHPPHQSQKMNSTNSNTSSNKSYTNTPGGNIGSPTSNVPPLSFINHYSYQAGQNPSQQSTLVNQFNFYSEMDNNIYSPLNSPLNNFLQPSTTYQHYNQSYIQK